MPVGAPNANSWKLTRKLKERDDVRLAPRREQVGRTLATAVMLPDTAYLCLGSTHATWHHNGTTGKFSKNADFGFPSNPLKRMVPTRGIEPRTY